MKFSNFFKRSFLPIFIFVFKKAFCKFLSFYLLYRTIVFRAHCQRLFNFSRKCEENIKNWSVVHFSEIPPPPSWKSVELQTNFLAIIVAKCLNLGFPPNINVAHKKS